MKTYSAHWESGGILFQNKPASEIWNLIPNNSKLIGGDATKQIEGTKDYKTIPQARYRCGDRILVLRMDGL